MASASLEAHATNASERATGFAIKLAVSTPISINSAVKMLVRVNGGSRKHNQNTRLTEHQFCASAKQTIVARTMLDSLSLT